MLFTERDEDTIFVDAIKSKISPGKDEILEMLDHFENDQYGNYDLSDLCDNILNNLEKTYKLKLGINDKYNVRVFYYDDHKFDLKEYRVTLEWSVFEILLCADIHPILPSEVPFILEFLNTPQGQENEAVEKWNKYWGSVDFNSCQGVAPM